MLRQYEAMTIQKLEERKELKERRPSLRTEVLLKQSFDAVNKPAKVIKPNNGRK